MSAAPNTPSGQATRTIEEANMELKAYYESLNSKWDLRLLQSSVESPMSRQSRSKSEEDKLIHRIMFYTKYLFFKEKPELIDALESFKRQALGLYSGWVHKPRADRGVVPEKTRHRPRPITSDERTELRKCLMEILEIKYQSCQSVPATPSFHRLQQLTSSNVNMSVRSTQKIQPDDSPVPFVFSSARKLDGKHLLESFSDINVSTKKAKMPETKSSSRRSLSKLPPPQWHITRPQSTKTDQVKTVSLKGDGNTNADTSFATNVSSMFSQSYNNTLVNTQVTDPEPEPVTKLRADPHLLDDQGPKTQSSDYFGSSFDVSEVDSMESRGAKLSSQEVPNVNMVNDMGEEMLDGTMDTTKLEDMERCLNEIMPILPSCLKKAPFFISYEITRVFLFLQIPMTDFNLLYCKEWEDYDSLWKMLKSLPVLQGKKFPERCGANVWDIATRGYMRGLNGIVFTATLCENKKQPGPLLSFQLKPMKLDLTHRLDRRFGSDRFLEFVVPDLESRKYASIATKVEPNALDNLTSWLANGDLQLLGRTYKGFYVRSEKSKKTGTVGSDTKEEGSAPPFRVYLFATDGYGFVKGSRARGPAPLVRVRMSVGELLDSFRPTSSNEHQPYMKLFARTALVVSRNSATVIVERNQIRHKKDIRNTDANDPNKTYVMTDGAGRMSLALAREIVLKLELSFIPSAFQGRFGEAKGLWIVDRSEDIENEWIELYGEQCKWKWGEEISNEYDHKSHRTFEVLRYSAPLKTADLNTQLLPILVHQAVDKDRMKFVILDALKMGLDQSLKELTTALTSPREFRSWFQLTNSSIQDRIKNDAVQWRGGLPAKYDDRLSMLLDAGFDPRESQYVMDLAKGALIMRCDELNERLNITIPKSTKVYMVPDFWGVLGPNEVHLEFSSFVDNESGLSDTQLENQDVLVARNPAHYPSDIQRVTAVSKHELRHLKDVIVFSTRGYPSLAEKLSGGDYDGDIAWVCWDRAIVENFINADVPEVPDLVKDGFIEQDKTTYAQLIEGSSDPTNTFLLASFKFNMRQSMLGQCTTFKDDIEYKIRDLKRTEITFLSTLLSNLVDQTKQGFIFTEKHWKKVKSHIIATTGMPRMPAHKNKKELPCDKDHILDHAKIVVHEQTEAMKVKLWKSIDHPPPYEPILAKFYKDQRVKAEVPKEGNASPEEMNVAREWTLLLDQLDKDVSRIKHKWTCSFTRSSSKKHGWDSAEDRPDFAPIRDSCFEEFCAIKPHADNKLISAWPDQDLESKFGTWALLRASALWATFEPRKTYKTPDHISTMAWWMAGRQYMYMKANQKGVQPVCESMYAMLKANTGFVKQWKAHEGVGTGMGMDVEREDVDDEFDDEDVFDDWHDWD